ncbi:MAG TPA: hypothetical protein VHV74_23640 [Pseudonocardiaceae bacterium]|jgi:hypothetical protein|nr:hypothetical protein [Pseudonocardiaceae bacterium]
MLRELCDVTPADSSATIRDKLSETLRELAERLPGDLRLVVTVSLALQADTQHQFLQERVQFLADLQRRDVRTIRRRMDEGFDRLAEIATTPSELPDLGSGLGWYIGRMESILRMDKRTPECFERSTIVAERDGVDRVQTRMTLPKEAQATGEHHDLFPELYFGAALLSTEREYGDRFNFELGLPRPLMARERHDFGIILRVPEDQPMATHYVLLPDRRCDEFHLRVRFDREKPPAMVWRVTEVFHRELDEHRPSEDLLTVDEVGEVSVTFTHLRPGHGYGVQWLPA